MEKISENSGGLCKNKKKGKSVPVTGHGTSVPTRQMRYVCSEMSNSM
jgi:hypothetical protein